MTRAPVSRFEIWQTGQAIHSIDNPVRLKILKLLEGRSRRLTDLMLFTRKAKSTLSAVHLPPLIEMGLVEEAADPKDARVKWYRLLGHRLGSSAVDAGRLREAVLNYVHTTGGVPLPSLLGVIDPSALVASGADPEYQEALARRIGQAVGRTLTQDSMEGAAAELAAMFEREGLGALHLRAGAVALQARERSLQRFLTCMAEEALRLRLQRVVRVAALPARRTMAKGAA